MSKRAEQCQRLKRWLADMPGCGHLEGLKVRRKQRIQSVRWRRRILRESKEALCRWWAEAMDEAIMRALKENK